MPWKNGPFLAPAAAVAAGFFAYASPVLADTSDDRETPDQIVVVAHKDERSIREIAANVTVVTADSIRDELSVSIADVFRNVPGVDHESAGARFGAEGINIRGIGGNRVAILVDGVPLSDQFDIGSFSNATRDFIDTGLVAGIEILHGPASALYGSAAIGGVVAVRTPDPADVVAGNGFGGDAGITWRGDDGSAHARSVLGFSGATTGFLVGASVRDGHEHDAAAAPGSPDTRDYRRRTALVKLVADNRYGHTWRASVIRQDADTGSELVSLLGSGRFRSTTALEGDDRYTLDAVNFAFEFGEPGGWVDDGIVRAYLLSAKTGQDTLDERANARTPVSIDRYFEFEQDVAGIEFNAWKEFSGETVSHRLGFGVELRERRTEEYRDGLSTDLATGEQTKNLLGEVFPLRDFPISETLESAAFIEDTLTFGNWTVIAALRADRYDLKPKPDAMYLEDYPFVEIVSVDESELSPKFGVIYKLTNGIDLYAQYSHGFRAPPYADANIGLEIPFFNYRAIPNPDLRSETSNGVDVGMRWQGERSSARLSAFRTRYEDFIESRVQLGTDPVSGRTLFQSQNIHATVIEGIEAAATIRFEHLSIDGAAYYADGENRDNGQPLNSVGPAEAVLGLSWHASDDRRRLRLVARLSEAWDDLDETRNELFEPAGYAVFDLFLTQRVGQATTLRAGVHNLADKTYWHWADVRGLSPTDPMLPTLSRAGRSASVSLDVNW